MGFQAVDEVRDRLKKWDASMKTTLVLNHMAHYGDFTHEKICALENPKAMRLPMTAVLLKYNCQLRWALSQIEDTDGKIYTLMTTGSCLGTAINMNVCEAAWARSAHCLPETTKIL